MNEHGGDHTERPGGVVAISHGIGGTMVWRHARLMEGGWSRASTDRKSFWYVDGCLVELTRRPTRKTPSPINHTHGVVYHLQDG